MGHINGLKSSQSGPIDHPAFWALMEMMEKSTSPLGLEKLCAELEISEVELSYFLAFLEKLSYNVEVKLCEGEKILIPPSEQARVAFEFSLKDWLAFQAHFPYLEGAGEKPFHEVFVERMVELEGQHPEHDLFRALEEEGEEVAILKGEIGAISERDPELLPLIYEATTHKQVFEAKLQDQRVLECFAHKVVYLDGGLSIIGEDIRDRSLLTFYIDSIEDLRLKEDCQYKANFSAHEVADFIAAIRAVSGIEERLVLKVVGQPDLNFRPPFLFLGNPYITTNLEGERIWAATVEPSPELYEWLYQMRTHIQVLDPIEMAQEFEDYCHRKACELDTEIKKAS